MRGEALHPGIRLGGGRALQIRKPRRAAEEAHAPPHRGQHDFRGLEERLGRRAERELPQRVGEVPLTVEIDCEHARAMLVRQKEGE